MKNKLKSQLKILVGFNKDYDDINQDNDLGDPYSCLIARSSIYNVASNVKKTLHLLGYQHIDLIGFKNFSELDKVINNFKYDLFFNLCESLEENSSCEALVIERLEKLRIPFTGNNSNALRFSLDKFISNKLLKSRFVTVPNSFLIQNYEDFLNKEIPDGVYILKPNEEDGSAGINFSSVVKNREELTKQVKSFFQNYKGNAILQEYIEGREVNLVFINSPNEFFWGFSEIEFKNFEKNKPKILTYSSKWNTDSIDYINTTTINANISSKIKEKMISSAIKTINALDLKSYGRIDFRIDTNGTPYIIDINPNCDLDPDAGFSKTGLFNGLTYSDLIEKLVQNALWTFDIKLLDIDEVPHFIPNASGDGLIFEEGYTI